MCVLLAGVESNEKESRDFLALGEKDLKELLCVDSLDMFAWCVCVFSEFPIRHAVWETLVVVATQQKHSKNQARDDYLFLPSSPVAEHFYSFIIPVSFHFSFLLCDSLCVSASTPF